MLAVKPTINEDREAKELQLYIVNRTLEFIDEEYAAGAASIFKDELKKKYEKLAKQLSTAIQTHRERDNKRGDIPIVSLTSLQQARVEVGRFQRELLLKLHKEGLFSSKSIYEVEKMMDIDQLQFELQIPEQSK